MKKPLAFLTALALVLVGLAPTIALAAGDDSDILLGVFFTSEEDVTDTVYASYDGETFHAIDTAYRDNTPASASSNIYLGNHYTHKCPGLCYYKGYFWMISSWNVNDGKFHPILSYSKDLKTWTHPEGTSLGKGYGGIELEEQPANMAGKFDVVAPKMHVASDGNLYMTFSAGYYGEFHGEPTKDKMQLYMCKVDLSVSDGTSAGDGYLWPNVTLKAQKAKRITAPAVANDADTNIIDSNLYVEGDATYLLLKRDGLIEEIYSSKTPGDPSSWQLVNENAASGYEGVSIVKANGTYYLIGDGVLDTRPQGIRLVTSDTITRSDEWTDAASTADDNLHAPTFLAEDGKTKMTARHGDVITLKAGTAEWKLVKDMLDGNKAMYRLYNPNSGEHFYTANAGERNNLQRVGWRYEGIGWTAPVSSSTPVYRLYSGTDHHYTTSAKERDNLVKAGWKYEGVGWYSDDEKGVPLYRQYNPNVNPRARRNNSGSHNYTTSTAERDRLVSLGWRSEGIGWYGVK